MFNLDIYLPVTVTVTVTIMARSHVPDVKALWGGRLELDLNVALAAQATKRVISNTRDRETVRGPERPREICLPAQVSGQSLRTPTTVAGKGA